MTKLVVISGPQAGLSHILGKQWVTIGRNPGNAFRIAEPSVSGQHCEVRARGRELEVRDMRSTNGTFINGSMVTEGAVKAGQVLRLGQVELRFEAEPVLSVYGEGESGTSQAESSAGSSAEKNENSNKRQVLLVDDSMALLETAGELFATLSGGAWEVHTACGADQALALIQRKRIEVAVLDISMPMLDGIQLLGMLHRRHPEIKKVILTSAPSEANRLQCLSAGAELFLEKPATADGFRFVFNVLQDLMNWRQAEGFCGTLQQVGLPDIIQIECLRRNSCILEVRDGQARGEIYIESGLIVHALTEALSGEKAFHALLSLNNGRFQLLPYQPPPRRSIQGSWEWLLMESARVRDEEKGSRSEDKTVLIQRSQADTHAKPASQADSQQEQTGQRKAEPEALSSNGVEVPDLGGEIVVISTYDGKWNPVKKPE